jgi:CRISPR system Cascade subunit CasA
MTYSFNLIDEPWIPCLKPDGKRVELGLRDVLVQAHKLHEIHGDTPLETAALHRLLLAVLHRVFGPEKPNIWKSLWEQEDFDRSMLENYLHRPEIHRRFDLFDPEKPFYQPCKRHEQKLGEVVNNGRVQHKGKMSLEEFLDSSNREDVEPKSVISLLLHAASGDNAVLFDHSTKAVGISLTLAQAARALITSQLFGFGGTSGVRENFTDAPGAKGILFFARGRNLFETLILNMVQYEGDKPLPILDASDLPAWEMEDPFVPDRKKPRGYLDYLTWHNRRIWLLPEEVEGQIVVRDMYWVPGLELDADVVDPMMHYFEDKKGGVRPLCFTSNRALWRDSKVLFQLGEVNEPPQVVQWLSRLANPPNFVLNKTRRFQLMALGMAKNQARLDFLRSENLPLPVDFLKKPDLVGELGRALQAAESSAFAIRTASFVLAWLVLYPTTNAQVFESPANINSKIKSGSRKQSKDEEAKRIYKLAKSWGVERYYWSDLDVHFHYLIQDLPDAPEQVLQTWRGQVRRAATAAFNQAERYAGSDGRTMRAVAVARQRFNIGLAAAVGKASEINPMEGGDQA